MLRDCSRAKLFLLWVFLAAALLHACQPGVPTQVSSVPIDAVEADLVINPLQVTANPSQPLPTATPLLLAAITRSIDAQISPLPVEPTVTEIEVTPLSTPAAPRLLPTNTLVPSTPTATVEPTATYWPTVTRQKLPPEVAAGLTPCESRLVSDDLLLVVTQQFALPESYVPTNLVLLSDYFPNDVTRGLVLYARADMIEPLQHLMNDMNAVGLNPSILSAYRGYDEQALAWQWWGSQYPDRVAIMSARPGYSEHQLGTTFDFGSPALNHLFHVDFAIMDEGIWLADNAYRYGFTLTYPKDSYAVTGFKYEPWHYRYVGLELAGQLFNSGQNLTQWQLATMPPPCIP